MNNVDVYYHEAFSRNIGLFSQEEQKRLRSARIAIAGMGGVGGIHLMTLTRLGIGRFTIADGDCFESANLQRQYGARMETLGKNKAEVMRQEALAINPHLEIKVFPGGISPENVDEFLAGADIVVDGIDFFCFEARRLIFKAAKKKGLWTVTAGPLGFGSAMLVFSPGGMGFDEYFDIHDRMSETEKLVAFAVGLAPAALQFNYLKLEHVDWNSKKGPSLVCACHLCSALAATEVLNILLARKPCRVVPHYCQFDPYEHSYKKGYLCWGNRNPLQRLKRWYLLKRLTKRHRFQDRRLK